MAETHTKIPPVDLIQRVMRTVKHFGMFETGDKVLMGVSGGPDSMALMHILHALAPLNGLELGVAHLNHGLRPQVDESEAAFVHCQAQKYGLAYYAETATIDCHSGSLEERAREARYAFYKRISDAQGYNKIALGHQADDNAEAVLLHLLRGSGSRGLAGIPPVRAHRFVRPLIHLRRKEILAYLEMQRIPFVLDSTNTDQRFTRNRIRHHLLPLLERDYNPNLVNVLNRLADLCRDEELWLENLLQPLLERLCIQSDHRALELSAEVLDQVPRAAQRRLLREALRRWQGDLRRISADHVDALRGLITSRRQGSSLDLPGALRARRTRHSVLISTNRATRGKGVPAADEFIYHVNSDQGLPMAVEIVQAQCRLKFTRIAPPPLPTLPKGESRRVLFDLDQISFPLVVRNFRPGDRLNPYGMTGSQKVKKLLIDRKIERTQRARIPLLVSREGVLWVVGVRRSAVATLSRATRQALQVEVCDSGDAQD